MSTLPSKNTEDNIKDSIEMSTDSSTLDKQFTQSIDGLNKKQNKLESDIQKRCAQAINSTVENKASDSKPLVQKALASKSKRPLIYGALTMLAFLGAAAILYLLLLSNLIK